MPRSGTYRGSTPLACSPGELHVNQKRNTREYVPGSYFMNCPVTFQPVNSTYGKGVINDTLRWELAGAQKTQQELAEFLGISQSAISRRFHNGHDWSMSDLTRIGDWLGINLVRKADQNLALREISA